MPLLSLGTDLCGVLALFLLLIIIITTQQDETRDAKRESHEVHAEATDQ